MIYYTNDSKYIYTFFSILFSIYNFNVPIHQFRVVQQKNK